MAFQDPHFIEATQSQSDKGKGIPKMIILGQERQSGSGIFKSHVVDNNKSVSINILKKNKNKGFKQPRKSVNNSYTCVYLIYLAYICLALTLSISPAAASCSFALL